MRASDNVGNDEEESMIQDGGKPNNKKEPEWKKYQNMSVEEKRKYYECDANYVQIEDIETWSKFYQENGYYFTKIKKSNKFEEPAFPVNAKLNDKISLWQGDITRLEIDAIVNAANKSLLGGGGVDGCIHRAAGMTLIQECRTLKGCSTGNAKITSGHKLPARHIIHTVGPIGRNEKALKSCYENCLKCAFENEVRTLAFCCVSTGIYGYPNKDAAEVALKTTRQWLEDEKNAEAIDRIIFCLYLDKDIKIYHALTLKYFPPGELQRPTKKQAGEPAKEPAKGPEKEPGLMTEKDKSEKDKSDKKGNKEDEEMKTERNEEGKEKLADNSDEEKKNIQEMQKGRGQDNSSSKVTKKPVGARDDNKEELEKKEEKPHNKETKKVEMQRGLEVKENKKIDAVNPTKKRKQEDNSEMREEEDVVMTEGGSPEKFENAEIREQDKNMDVGEDLPKQVKDKDEQMRTKEKEIVTMVTTV